jgi:hypothetical protein
MVMNKKAVAPQTSYSPHLSPSNFFLFPKMKLKLKGKEFNGVLEMQQKFA